VSSSPHSPFSAPGGAAHGGPAASAPKELERKLIESVAGRFEIARLPAAPLIIDRALGASRQPDDASQVCEWLALDPVLALRVLDATAGYEQVQPRTPVLSLAERVGALAPELLRSLLMSTARCSLGPEPALLAARELGEFWIHALRVAFLGRALAEACSYRAPEEAYLTGLLHDIGSFALLATVPNTLRSLVATQANAPWGAVPEHAGRLGTIHAQIGATLLERLQLPFYISDAVLLHHAPMAELEGTHLLVRILCCAEALMLSRSAAHPHGATADLLGISASAVSDAERAAAEKVNAVLRGLGRLGLTKSQSINAPPVEVAAPASGASQRLTETLVMRFVREAEQSPSGDTPLEQSSGGESSRTDDPAQVGADEDGWAEALALHGTNVTAGSILDQIASQAVHLEAATLLRSAGDLPRMVAELLPLARVVAGVRRAALFVASVDREGWPAWLVDGEAPLRVELELSPEGQSLLARAARQAGPLASYEQGRAGPLTGLDLQVARMLAADEFAAIPIRADAAVTRGVLVVGTSAMKASRFAQGLPFLVELAGLVGRSSGARSAPPAAQRSAEPDELQAATRRLVHEARNPLSVLKTYLQIARTRAKGGADLEKELEIANQEVERVACLLDAIGKPQQKVASGVRPVEVNRLIEELLLLYGEALFAEKKIVLSPMLDASILPISCDEEGLKQVLLNLLINASDALSSGDQVMVCTSNHVNYEGQVMVEISVADNGPGMPPEKISGLFASPGAGRTDAVRGIGLPTSLAVVRAMGGHLVCRSRLGEGTTFAILLPRTAGPEAQPPVGAPS
jgi:signal transduction histidine kinase/HD-like signal output (HDOD) protein